MFILNLLLPVIVVLTGGPHVLANAYLSLTGITMLRRIEGQDQAYALHQNDYSLYPLNSKSHIPFSC